MYVSGDANDTYVYAGVRVVSGLTPAQLELKVSSLTMLFEAYDVRHAIRELRRDHQGEDGEGPLTTPFDGVQPVCSVIIHLHAPEVSPTLTLLRETAG